MSYTESKLQQECVKWFRLKYKGVLILAIPNGAYLHKSVGDTEGIFPYQRKTSRVNFQAMRLLREGLVPGIPDLFVAKPAGEYGGLFIEMKSETGRLSEKQENMIGKLRKAGYCVEVCKSFDNFIDVVNKYMNM